MWLPVLKKVTPLCCSSLIENSAASTELSSSLVDMDIRDVHLPHGFYSSEACSTSDHLLGMLKCCPSLCIWINTMSLEYIISKISFNSIWVNRVRDWQLTFNLWDCSWNSKVTSKPSIYKEVNVN
uniref:Uncharacterized protein n=1 Tax=Pipistrellus kuhlii TaxID=59472 RepID=A0A7J7WLH9_PIPKU|nr:hypothetical protein mPipKuh1_007948 [Pipistrellus kuhlii]